MLSARERWRLQAAVASLKEEEEEEGERVSEGVREGVRERGGGALRLLTRHGHLQSSEEAEDLLATILTVCRHNIPLTSLESECVSDRVSEGEPITPSQLLQVALRLPTVAVAQQAVLEFVNLMQCGVVSGRAAVYVMSDLRQYFQSRVSSVLTLSSSDSKSDSKSECVSECVSDSSGGLNMNPLDAARIKSLGEEFVQVAQACLECVCVCVREVSGAPSSAGLFNCNVNSSRNGSSTSVVDSTSTCSNSSASASITLELLPCLVEQCLDFAEDVAEDIIDSLFVKPWPSHLIVTLCNLVCDIMPHLSAQHYIIFQRKLMQAIPSVTQDDFPGLIRVCLQLIETRDGDVAWLHMLRIMYASMLAVEGSSDSARLNCEALLEQACAMIPLHVCTSIIQEFEKTALVELHVSANNSHMEKNNMGTYTEYNGVPCMAPSDIQLLLLLFRSSAVSSSLQRGGSSGGAHLLPVPTSTRLNGGAGISLSSSCGRRVAAEGEYHFYTCCRSCFVLILCCAVNTHVASERGHSEGVASCNLQQLLLSVVEQQRIHEPREKGLCDQKSLVSCCQDVLQRCLRGSSETTYDCLSLNYAGSSSSSSSSSNASWAMSARAQDLVTFILHLTVHKAVSDPCVAAMMDMSPSDDKASSRCDFQTNLVEKAVQIILTSCMGVVFDVVQDSQPSILSSLLSTIIVFSTSGGSASDVHLPQSKSKMRKANVENYNPRKSLNKQRSPVEKLTDCLYFIVKTYKLKVLVHTPLLHGHIATLTLLRLSDASKALTSLALLAGDCRLLFGGLLTFYRKSLLHRDDSRKVFAIVSLLDLLAQVGESAQMEIIQIVLHVLVLPLQFRRLLYHTLYSRLQATSSQSVIGNISTRVLNLLLDKLTCHLNTILFGNADWTNYDYEDLSDAGSSSGSIMLQNCVDVVTTDNDTAVTFKEDIQGLLELVMSIESYLAFQCQSTVNLSDEAKRKSIVMCFNGLIQCLQPTEPNISSSISKSGPRVKEHHSHLHDHFPITAKYMKNIIEVIEGGFLLVKSKGFSEQDPPSTYAADTSRASNPTPRMKSSVLGFMFPCHALVRAAIGILRTNFFLVQSVAKDTLTDLSGYYEAISTLYIAIHTIFEITKVYCSDIKSYKDFIVKVSNDVFVGRISSLNGCEFGFSSLSHRLDDTRLLLKHLLIRIAPKDVEGMLTEEISVDNGNKIEASSESAVTSIYFGMITILCYELGVISERIDEKENNCRESSPGVVILRELLSIYEAICQINKENALLDRVCDILVDAARRQGKILSPSQDTNSKKRKQKSSLRGSRKRKSAGFHLFPELSEEDSSDNESDDNVCVSSDLIDMLDDKQGTSFFSNFTFTSLKIVQTMYKNLPLTVCHDLNRSDLSIFSSHNVLDFDASKEKRFTCDLRESLRYSLFAVRSQILQSISKVLISLSKEGFPVNTSSDGERNCAFVSYFCKELSEAVERGLSVRNFKAYIEALKAAKNFRPQGGAGLDGITISVVPNTCILSNKSSRGLKILKSLAYMSASAPASLLRELLALYLDLCSWGGCLTLFKALSQIMYINSRNPHFKLADMDHLQNEEEVSALLEFFKKNPKIIDSCLLDALTFVHDMLSKTANEYRISCKGVENTGFERFVCNGDISTVSMMHMVSELVFWPLQTAVDPKLVLLLKEATQVKSSDSLLGLGDGVPSRSKSQSPRGGRFSGRGSSDSPKHPELILPSTFLQLFGNKLERKYYALLTKYISLCCKQCHDVFKRFREELNYQSALKELNSRQLQRRKPRLRNMKKVDDEWNEPNPFTTKDEAYTEGDLEEEEEEEEEEFPSDRVVPCTDYSPPSRLVFNLISSPQLLVDILTPTVDRNESILVGILRERASLQLLLPQGSAVVARAEELVLRLQDEIRLTSWQKHKQHVMRHLEYDQVQFFEHVDGYVHALDEGLRQAGCFLSSGSTERAGSLNIKSSRQRKRRLRSRNSVIDDWLEAEDGTDTFVDLEDFLVF